MSKAHSDSVLRQLMEVINAKPSVVWEFDHVRCGSVHCPPPPSARTPAMPAPRHLRAGRLVQRQGAGRGCSCGCGCSCGDVILTNG